MKEDTNCYTQYDSMYMTSGKSKLQGQKPDQIARNWAKVKINYKSTKGVKKV